MHKSVDRILVTHVGSFPRGEQLGELLIEDELGHPVDKAKLAEEVDQRVRYVLQKQREAGVDIANDGEQGRVGFQTYVPQRMSGFGGVSKRPFAREFIEFPLFTKQMLSRTPKTGKVFDAPQAVGRASLQRYHGHRYRDRPPETVRRRGEAAISRVLQERAFAGDHLDDDAQRILSLARGLSGRDRPRDALRIPCRGGRRFRPANRRA